jgi:Na+/H+-dicarboxylate symporter
MSNNLKMGIKMGAAIYLFLAITTSFAMFGCMTLNKYLWFLLVLAAAITFSVFVVYYVLIKPIFGK